MKKYRVDVFHDGGHDSYFFDNEKPAYIFAGFAQAEHKDAHVFVLKFAYKGINGVDFYEIESMI